MSNTRFADQPRLTQETFAHEVAKGLDGIEFERLLYLLAAGGAVLGACFGLVGSCESSKVLLGTVADEVRRRETRVR